MDCGGTGEETPLTDMIAKDDNMLEQIAPQSTDSVAEQLVKNLDIETTGGISISDHAEF